MIHGRRRPRERMVKRSIRAPKKLERPWKSRHCKDGTELLRRDPLLGFSQPGCKCDGHEPPWDTLRKVETAQCEHSQRFVF